MPSYSISAPDGNTYTVAGPDGASREDVIREILSQHPEAGTARTFGGYAKEAVRGFGRGAVGFLESAGIGAAALLPEEVEKPVAAKIKELGDRFSPQAAPGYEDAIPTRLAEGVGSMFGTLAIPGGVIGKGLALGASGAGEARQRAQQEGATPEQISTATAQGIAPGLVDLLPVQFLLGKVGKVPLQGLISRGVRVTATGAVEGVTETAQKIMQNAIALGYNPEQDLYEGAAEEGAYGAGVGAIAQGLMDLALPGRARRGQQPQRETAQTPPEVAPPIAQEQGVQELAAPEALTSPEIPLAAETPQAQPIEAAEAAAPVVAVAPKVGVEAPPKQSSWKEFIGTNPDKTALEARLEEVNGRLAWEEAQPKRNQFRINGLKTQRDTKIPEALAAVAAPGVAPQVDVKTLLKPKKVTPDESLETKGVRPDRRRASDVQLVPPRKSREPGTEAIDVARVGGAESTVSGLTGREKVLPDAIKVPYKEVSVKDEETSVKVFNEYKQNQKGTTTPGTLDLTDPTIRASQTAVTPARVEAFAKNADLSETLARLDKKEPILVTQVGGKNVIVDGHHRVTAAKLTGLKEVPVHFLEADVKGKVKAKAAADKAAVDKAAAPTKGKINKAKLEKKVAEPIQAPKTTAPEVIPPERQQKIAEYEQLKDAPEAAKDYHEHYGSIEESLKNLGFDLAEETKKGEMGGGKNNEYIKEGGAPAQEFAEWVRKSGTPEQIKALGKYRIEHAKRKVASESERLLLGTEKAEKSLLARRKSAARDLAQSKKRNAPIDEVAEAQTVVDEVEKLEAKRAKQREIEALEKEEAEETKALADKVKKMDLPVKPIRKRDIAGEKAEDEALTKEEKADIAAENTGRNLEAVAKEEAKRTPKKERIENRAGEGELDEEIDQDEKLRRLFRASKGKAAAPTGNTKEDVTKALKNHFKEDSRFDALTTVVQSEADLPEEIRNSKDYRAGTRGVAYKNKVFLVADNIQRGRELGVFLHEAGAHIGFDNVLKPSDQQFLADQVRKWAKGKGDAVETVAAKAALEKGGKSNDEIIAYMTEELVNRGVTPTSFRPANTWLRRVVEAFKKVMTKLGLRQDITPQELVDFANGAAHIAMDTKIGQELAEFKRIATEVFDEPRFGVYDLGKARANKSIEKIAEEKTAQLNDPVYMEELNASIAAESDALQTYLQKTEPSKFKSGQRIATPEGKRGTLEFRVVNRKSDTPKWKVEYDEDIGKNEYDYFIEEGAFEPVVTSPPKSYNSKIKDVANKNPTSDPDIRFSQANPGLDNISADTLALFSGPSAPQSIVKQAYQTALNPRPEKFMQNLRQNFANKNTWWEDWFSSLNGNNALDTAGAASAIDRVQASTKVGGIQLATLDKGGFRKGANGLWEAYDTDASYKDIVEQVSQMAGKYKATPDFNSAQIVFNLAATAKREEGLMASGQTTDTGGAIKRTLNDAKLKEGLVAYNSTPEIQEALRLYKKFNDRNVDTLVTSGIIDAATATDLKGNAGYVPWFRFVQDANGDINVKAVREFSRGLINTSKMQDLEGGRIEDVQIGNILDNMAKLSNWMVGKSIGNDTSAFMVDFAIPYGQAKRVGSPIAGGVDAKRTVQIMRNGVPTYYEMSDPAALPAFKGYEAAQGAIVSLLAKPANILRKTITLNPVFSIAQLPQDSFRAFAASGLKNPYAIFPRVMKNFIKELYGRTDTGKELAKYGVIGKGSGMPTEASDNIRRQLGYYDKGAGGAWSRFTDGLERISSASDEAVRTALYELTLEEGGSQVLALRRAREIINFDTQGAGATSSFLRQTVPFMGVWMNDLNNLYKGLVLGSARLSEGEKNATRAAIVYRGMQLAGLVTLYTLMVGDDDDYKKLDDDTRNRSLIVPGTGFRVPVPNDGIGFLFKVIPEEVTRAVMAQGIESDDSGAKMGRAIWNGFKNIGSFENLLPGAGSPLIKTPVELILNKSFYTGNPIVGKSKEFLAPAEQYTEGTSEIAKQLGAALNLSPIKLDYLVRGLTAQVGGSVLAASNSLFHAADGKVTPSWSGDIKDIPLLGQLGYSRKDKADLEDYYELRHTVDKVSRTYRDMIASGRGKEAVEYLTDPTNQKAFALRQLQTQIDKGLAQYRNMEKLIYSNQRLDSDEMRRQLDRVDEMRTKYLQSLRLPKLRAFAEISPSLDSSAFRILR